jgi:hypothetical protein
LAETAHKIDNKLKKTLSTITKELDAIARAAIKDELGALAGGGGGGGGGASFETESFVTIG